MKTMLRTLPVLFLLARGAWAQEPVKVAVLEFTSKGGVTQDQMDALSEMLVNEMGKTPGIKVIDKTTIRQVLNLEEQKALLSSCSEQACLSEIGGALGVNWVVAGNVSQFGSAYLMNLRIVDVRKVELAAGVSRTVSGGQEQLISELPKAAAELLAAARERMGLKEVGTPPAETVKTPEPTPAEEAGGWFTTSATRKLRWTVSGMFGFTSVEKISYSGDDGVEASYATGGLTDIQSARGGLLGAGMGAFGLTEWLELRAWVGGGIAGDRDGSWTHRYFEIDGELAVYWPTSYWVVPYLCLGTGFGVVYSTHDTADRMIEMRGVAFNAGLGIDVHLLPRWFLGLRAGWTFKKYFTVIDDGGGGVAEGEQPVKGAFNGTSVALTGGYRF
jgi:TolB-like protein